MKFFAFLAGNRIAEKLNWGPVDFQECQIDNYYLIENEREFCVVEDNDDGDYVLDTDHDDDADDDDDNDDNDQDQDDDDFICDPTRVVYEKHTDFEEQDSINSSSRCLKLVTEQSEKNKSYAKDVEKSFAINEIEDEDVACAVDTFTNNDTGSDNFKSNVNNGVQLETQIDWSNEESDLESNLSDDLDITYENVLAAMIHDVDEQ